MMLLLTAAILVSYWALARRSAVSSIPCAISDADATLPAGAFDRFWSICRAHIDRKAIVWALPLAAVAIWITAIESQTNAPAKPTTSPEFYLTRGEDFSSSKQYDRAIADYDAAIELRPDYAEAYNDRGFAYYLKSDFPHAISDFTRAIDLRPNYPKAFNSRGVAYMQGGYGLAKSVPDFDRAIELKPDFRYAYINRANATLFHHPSLALQDFHRAGMHPERTFAVVVCVCLTAALAFTLLFLRRKRLRNLRPSGPA